MLQQSGTSVNILHIMCFSLEAETPDTSYLHLSLEEVKRHMFSELFSDKEE
jgi:hypothetical protein